MGKILFIFCVLFLSKSTSEKEFIYLDYIDKYPVIYSKEIKDVEIQKLGKEFRRNIDLIKIRLKSSEVPISQGVEKIKDLVDRYIKKGDSFDYAEKLLQSAGMGINADPAHVPPREGVRSGYMIAMTTLESFWLGYAGLAVILNPLIKDDFSEIGEVKVNIFNVP